LLFAENHKLPELAFGPKSIAIRQNKCGTSHEEKTQMKQDLTVKQTCKTCNKELHQREYFMYEIYNDFCEVLDERGLLHLEMEQDLLPEFVEKYWDCFVQYLYEIEGDNPDHASQDFDGYERWYQYLDAKLDHRINGFECTNCIISRTPHP
jgi:hypothetical protein